MDQYVIRIEGPLPADAPEGFTELPEGFTELPEGFTELTVTPLTLDEPPHGVFG
jgi:hypothetical protein